MNIREEMCIKGCTVSKTEIDLLMRLKRQTLGNMEVRNLDKEDGRNRRMKLEVRELETSRTVKEPAYQNTCRRDAASHIPCFHTEYGTALLVIHFRI
jgi:hypothetical protein